MAPRKRTKREDAAASVAEDNDACTEDGQQQETRRKSARVRQVRAAESAPPATPASAPSSSRHTLTRALEQSLASKGTRFVIGVDEAGRGPLAGPVVAAACCLPADLEIEGIYDSKAVQEEDRERIYEALIANPNVMYAWARVEPEEIEEINILQAAMLAMNRSVAELISRHSLSADDCYALVDGPYLPDLPVEGKPVVKGDSKVLSIAAASIIAKVVRDKIMTDYDKEYPGYGLAQHKGYPTAAHVGAVIKLGPSRIHRLTFRPIPQNFPDAMERLRGKAPVAETIDIAGEEVATRSTRKVSAKGAKTKKQTASSAKKKKAVDTEATTQRPKRAAASKAK